MADAGQQPSEPPLALGEQPERPAQVRIWYWAGDAVVGYEYRWPDDDRRLQRFVDDHGFGFEFRAGTDHYPIAETYSRDLAPGANAFPYQYMVAVVFGSHFELILAERLPDLFDVLRYLDPVINR